MIGNMRKCVGLIALGLVVCAGGCRRSPQAQEAYYLKDGKERLRRKDYARALLQLRNAVKIAPRDAEAHYQLGLASMEAGELAIGIAHLRRATELDPQLYAAQMSLVQLMLQNGDPAVLADARKRLELVVAARPDDPAALTALGLVEGKLGNPVKADEQFRLALQKDPRHLDASTALARSRLLQNDVAGAETVLRQAVANAPKSAAPLVALAGLYTAGQRLPEAEQPLVRAVALEPASGLALNQLAQLQFRMGRTDAAEESCKRLARLPDPQYRAAHALFLQQTGKKEAAAAELETLYARDRSDRNIRSLLVNSCMESKKFARARSILGEALKANAMDVEALTSRATLNVVEGKLLDAQQDMMQVLRFHPDSATAHQSLALIYKLRGFAGSERQELSEALRLDPDLWPARLDLARNLIRGGAPQEALRVVDETKDPRLKDSVPVIELRNWALLAMHDLTAAQAGIENGLKRSRTNDLLLQSAELMLERKDMAGARARVQEVLKSAPENETALQLLVATYSDPREAAARIQQYLAARPQSAVLQYRLGQCLLACGKTVEARAAWEAARAANPNLVDVAVELARLDLREGKVDTARQMLTPLAAQSNQAMLALSMVERQAGHLDAAIALLRKALDREPQNPMVLNNLAYLLADRGAADEALMLAQKAKEVAPHNASVDDTIGWAYFKKGIYRPALQYFELAVGQEASARHQAHLAMACARLGDVQRARTALDAALKAAPDLPEAQAARQLLSQTGTR